MARCTQRFACPTASRSGVPFAKPAVIAAEKVQPVPWSARVSMRGDDKRTISTPSKKRSSASPPPSAPPFTTTAPAPIETSSRAATSMSASERSSLPISAPASWRFGVRSVASGNSRSRTAATISSPPSGAPCLEISTGSTTSGTPGSRPSASATPSTIAALPIAPVLMAWGAKSVRTDSICPTITSSGSRCTPCTPRVFCSVIRVSALQPKTSK